MERLSWDRVGSTLPTRSLAFALLGGATQAGERGLLPMDLLYYGPYMTDYQHTEQDVPADSIVVPVLMQPATLCWDLRRGN